jgi:hypothetical protein
LTPVISKSSKSINRDFFPIASVTVRFYYHFRAVLDCMVLPLQDKLEDWKKSATTMDKDHAKEYKKLRSEVKKRSELYLFFWNYILLDLVHHYRNLYFSFRSEAVSRAQKKQKKSKSGSNDQHIASKALGQAPHTFSRILKLRIYKLF